ncbi:MAG: hypothetical protein A2206_01290 [Candidatus Magasanikbacteria bacterium RIFOXYA1_FULL_40_8]|uniref:Uncharacterized protein n=1 Tax=Candidatus Magasanikbacteria bacterium RIFOXYA1_FULL_40_8 TaxID=1798694 RepID=A0A1F6NTZ0_9BACT|nr:MAG: hypothetical protein A2206_01290 [Candidatus Magasanikbacteria bacterium RIFOXYA1_FULL_40_8]
MFLCFNVLMLNMPVKKGKSKKNIDSDVKKQIKNTVEKLPQLIVEEMKESQKINTDYYDNPSYKNKKVMMWVFVAVFCLIIAGLWIININTVFYDFTKSLGKNNGTQILKDGQEILQDSYKNDLGKIMDDVEKLFAEEPTEETAEPKEKKPINLDDIVNAVNNFTSTTTNTATSTEDTTTSTEETAE